MSDKPTHGDQEQGFLDAASGIPMSTSTRRALARAWDLGSADPSKRYPAAAAARQMLEHARSSIAATLARQPSEIAFVSGSADDTMALAMRSAVTSQARRNRPGHSVKLVISNVEELGVLRAAENLALSPPTGASVEVVRIPVDTFGAVSPDEVLALSGQSPAVVAVQAANGELGTRQPISALSESLPDDALLVVDGRHCVGRCPLPIPADLLIAQPTTWGGPPGIGVLIASDPKRLPGLSAPTDGKMGVEQPNSPVPIIAAAGLSLEAAGKTMHEDLTASFERTEQIRDQILNRIPDVLPLGHPTSRLGYVSMFSFLYVAADELVDELARSGWSVSSGSACTSDTHRPLHVLQAIDALTHGNLRVSLPPWTTSATVDAFVDDLVRIVSQLRVSSGVTEL